MTEHDRPMTITRAGAGLFLQLLAIVLALLGGVFGILGALFQESRSANFLFLVFVGAPIIEEALKPSGVYLMLLRWPRALVNQLHIALLAALGGLAFGVVESLLYVNIYVDDPSDAFVLFRFTVTVALHMVASFIVGLGISQGIFDWASGRAPFPKRTRNFFIAGALLHGLYNLTAVSLELSGVLDLG